MAEMKRSGRALRRRQRLLRRAARGAARVRLRALLRLGGARGGGLRGAGGAGPGRRRGGRGGGGRRGGARLPLLPADRPGSAGAAVPDLKDIHHYSEPWE